MNQSPAFDPITLNAWLDQSNDCQCESWIEFLRFVLPILLKMPAEDIEELIDISSLDSIEQAIHPTENGREESMRALSVYLGEQFGCGSEFGLAAFIEASAPTRFYQWNNRKKPIRQRVFFNNWTNQLKALQGNQEFSTRLEEFKKVLDTEQTMPQAG